MGNDFNLSIENYVRKRDDYLQKHGQLGKILDFNLNALFSIFDKNYDGKISRTEYEKVSQDEYSNFVKNLKEHSEINTNSIWTYEELNQYLDDKFITSEDFDGETGKNYKLKTDKLAEVKTLKDINLMTMEEMLSELQSYGYENQDNLSERKIKNILAKLRTERTKYDENSYIVDGHIGTYTQGKSYYCSLLAKLDSMDDKQIKDLFVFDEGCDFDNPMLDDNGEKYWKIKFPVDIGTEDFVIITEKELQNRAVTVLENGNEREVADFPEGDEDVILLTMAYVKRFGTNITDNGAWLFETQKNFTKPDELTEIDNQHLEDLEDFSRITENYALNLLNKDELERKGISTDSSSADLSWLSPEQRFNMVELWGSFVLSNGIKGCYGKSGILLSDGTKITGFHALSIRGYDEERKEIIISGNDFNNLTETRIPIELAKFLEISSKPNFPGADKTPQPEL